MAKKFELPDLGEGIHEAEVFAVNVEPGQEVQEDDVILEVETDKAAVEIPSPYTDVISDVRVSVGDVVHVGDVLLVFGKDEVAEETAAAEEETKAAEETSPAGDVEAPERGAPHRGERPVPAAPSTRRLARELGVDLHDVPPSGPGGRVTKDDVRSFAEEGEGAAPEEEEREKRPLRAAGVSVGAAPELPDFEKWGEVEREPLRSVRRATAEQMARSWSQIPHVMTRDEVDITALEALRKRYKPAVEERGGKLTLTIFVLKALVNALKSYPKFNASLDVESGEIVLKHYYHVGVAVDTDRGLIVPVLRDVDRKSVVELAVELTELVERTRAGKADLAELKGGTMTITNVGALGGTGFAPIINFPEVAILGLAQARVKPVAQEREDVDPDAPLDERYEFVPRLMLPVILTFDHRVNDGAEAQRFLNAVIEQLKDPEKLLLGL